MAESEFGATKAKEDSYYERFLFQKPEIIGWYIPDWNKTSKDSLPRLRYLKMPKSEIINFDLNICLKEPMSDEYSERKDILEGIPRWLTEAQERHERIQADFVTYRSFLTNLMCKPYENKGWIACASKVNGIIFLFDKRRPKKTDNKNSCRRHKFVEYMTSDKPDSQPSTAEPGNEAHFDVMFKSRLDKHTLIYAAKIDAVESEEVIRNLEGASLIDMKVTRNMYTDKQHIRFNRYQLIRWWAQTFLAGDQKIIFGFHDNNVVNNIKCYTLAELEEMGKGLWNTDKGVTYCNWFLSHVKYLLQEEHSPYAVWTFELPPRGRVTHTRHENPTDLRFLPDWFLAHASSADADYVPE